MEILKASEAYQRLRDGIRNRTHTMPSQENGEQYDNGLLLPKVSPRFFIGESSRVFTIGSCFARNVEGLLVDRGLDVPVAQFEIPSGELPHPAPHLLNEYNAGTILQRIQNVGGAFSYSDDMGIEETSKGYVDLFLHIDNRPIPLQRLLERRREIESLYTNIFSSQVVVITLGLVESWYDNDCRCYLNKAPSPNLAKHFPGRFSFHRFGVDDVLTRLSQAIEIINAQTRTNILLTVSPIPVEATFMGESVVIANSYSKAVLRVVAEMLKLKFSNVDYFPSYEIATSLGTAGFERDNTHVRGEVVTRITNYMINRYSKGHDGAPLPSFAEAYATGMRLIYQEKANEQARDIALWMIEACPEKWQGYDLLGHLHGQEQNVNGALALAVQALERSPTSGGLYCRVGYVLLKMKDDAVAAEQYLRRAVELWPGKYSETLLDEALAQIQAESQVQAETQVQAQTQTQAEAPVQVETEARGEAEEQHAVVALRPRDKNRPVAAHRKAIPGGPVSNVRVPRRRGRASTRP